VKKDMPCHLREKTEYTPNDYNITFPTEKIPRNIKLTNIKNLELELQKAMPLTKKIHIKLEEKETTTPTNNYKITTDLTVRDKRTNTRLGVEIR
jgi:hypothetical protein